MVCAGAAAMGLLRRLACSGQKILMVLTLHVLDIDLMAGADHWQALG